MGDLTLKVLPGRSVLTGGTPAAFLPGETFVIDAKEAKRLIDLGVCAEVDGDIIPLPRKVAGVANPLAEKAKEIKAAATLAALDILAAGETHAGLLKAIEKRRSVLSA